MGGYIEVLVKFPGPDEVFSLQPVAWARGNPGRAGHDAP